MPAIADSVWVHNADSSGKAYAGVITAVNSPGTMQNPANVNVTYFPGLSTSPALVLSSIQYGIPPSSGPYAMPPGE